MQAYMPQYYRGFRQILYFVLDKHVFEEFIPSVGNDWTLNPLDHTAASAGCSVYH